MPAADPAHAGFGHGDDDLALVGRPSTLGKPKRSFTGKLARTACAVILVVAALAGVLRLIGIHPDTSTGAPGTTVSTPYYPPGSGEGGPPDPSPPTVVYPNSSNDIMITLTPGQGSTYDNGATTTETATLVLTNDGGKDLPAGSVYFYRGSDATTKVPLTSVVGSVHGKASQFAYPGDFAQPDAGTVTFPKIPAGASVEIDITYDFSGAADQITAVVSAPGMNIESSSTPSAHEAAAALPDQGIGGTPTSTATPTPSGSGATGVVPNRNGLG